MSFKVKYNIDLIYPHDGVTIFIDKFHMKSPEGFGI